MLWRDGARGTLALFRGMGLPGLAVALCFATASTSFVVALAYTTVANILLMQAGVPLIAALICLGCCFAKRSPRRPGLAIAAVIAGVAIMVSESFTGDVSPVGDGLALLIAVVFSIATVITRRFAHVRMTPATCLGTIFAAPLPPRRPRASPPRSPTWRSCLPSAPLISGSAWRCFATGARLIPAAFAALLGTLRNHSRPDLGLADPFARCRRAARSSAAPWCSRRCWSISVWSSGASRGRKSQA